MRFCAVIGIGAVLGCLAGCASNTPAGDTPSLQGSAPPSTTLTGHLMDAAEHAAREVHAGARTVHAVRTIEGLAVAFATNQEQSDKAASTQRPVWLLQVQGTRPFSCECNVRTGSGGEAVANYLITIVDATTYAEVHGAFLFNEPQPLRRLGTVLTVLGE